MAKKHFQRYLSIINILQRGKATFEEIDAYLRDQCDITSVSYNFSKRTFQLDIQDIAEGHSIDIIYDRFSKCYTIVQSEEHYQDRIKLRLLENAQINYALQVYNKADKWIDLEQRKPVGTELIQLILNCLENSKRLKFTHNSFWKEASAKTLEPLGLKEFKQRWYLVGKDVKDSIVKIYALDRISDLVKTSQTYLYPINFDIHHYYYDNFGVDFGEQEDPQEIILSFTPFQANYIKTLPLHHSQYVISENDIEYKIGLKLRITFDFQMEILAMGEYVTVIAPDALRKTISERLAKAVKNYN